MSDSDYLKTLVDHGVPERVAVRLLRLFLEQKTGEPWTFVTWDPTAEDPAPRQEFVRDRDLIPPMSGVGPQLRAPGF